ncbi:MAG: alpha/beta hydrolase [bacterium]|nr:alpha/beta hydrolase [bacterium]
MEEDLKLFDYVFINNNAPRTLVLLHGTGGDKHDLLFFNELLDKKYNLIGLQGNVTENGMPRFFKRISFGVFDQENIKEESEKLQKFIVAFKTKYLLPNENIFALGYSNGANMLLATLFYYPESISNLILLHPMLPFIPEDKSLKLSDHTIFITSGKNDQMISENDSNEVVTVLTSLNAKIVAKQYSGGHELTQSEILDIVEFLKY